MTTDYAAEIAALEAEILRLGALRNNQVSDTELWWSYQDRITAISHVLNALETSVEHLQAADDDVAAAQAAARRAHRHADHSMDSIWRLTKSTGLTGLAGLLLSAVWTPTPWLPVCAALLITIAVATVIYGIRIRSTRYALVDAADAALADAQARRSHMTTLINEGQPVTADAALL